MIFFLNLDGTMTRQDTGRIFQGSTAVPDIKVLSYVSSDTGSLSVSFTLPNKLATVYYPLAIVGEHVGENGFKTYLWGIKPDNEGIVKDLLGNVTQDVGRVGVSVRQTNTVTNEVVASYTADFEVEYSALPSSPTEATTDDIATLLDLLYAYYAQNQNLIDSIGRYNINERVGAVEEKVETLEEKVESLEEKTDVPVLVNISTDLETGVGTKYYSDGTTATFQIATDVTVVNRNDFLTEVSFASTSNWQTDTDGTYYLAFSPQTLDRTNNKCMAVIDKLDGNGVFQTGNGVFKGSDGTIILRGVVTPFDGKLLVLGGGSAGTKIWTGTTENGYEELTDAINGDYYLDKTSGNLYLLNDGVWTLLFSMRAEFPRREANTNGSVYVLTPNGNETPIFEALTVETTDHVTYSIKVGGKVAGTFELPQEIYLDDVSYDAETKTLSFIYNTESGEATIDIPLTDLEEVNNLLIVTTQSDFNDAVTSVNVGKVISYNSALYIVESVTENGTTTYRAKPYISLDEVTLFSTWQSSIENLATEDGDGITWTETSARVYAKNGVVSQPFPYEMRIPLIAGAGIEFEMSEDGQFVTIKSTGGGGNKIATTTAELDEAVAKEKKGTLVSYVGESTSGGAVGTPFTVGDEFETLYFNLESIPDLSKLEYDENRSCVVFSANYHSTTTDAIKSSIVITAMSGTHILDGLYAMMVNIGSRGNNTLYYSKDLPQEYMEQGWYTSNYDMGYVPDNGIIDLNRLAIGSVYGEVVEVANQEVVSQFLSKTPFVEGGSGYKKDTLYMVTDDGAKEVGGGKSISSIVIEGTDFVVSYSDGTTERVAIDYADTLLATTVDISSGITDVQVNGTSVVADGVANIPEASTTKAGVVTTGVQTFAGVKTFKNGLNIDGSSMWAIRGESNTLTFKRNEAVSGTSFMFTDNGGNRVINLNPNGNLISIRFSSKSHYIQLDTSQANQSFGTYLPIYSGTFMSTGAWSTGTSGTATLPSAGLYEINFTLYNNKHTALINWDGTTGTDACVFVDDAQQPGAFLCLYCTNNGLLEVIENAISGGAGGPASASISYRKIGIA